MTRALPAVRLDPLLGQLDPAELLLRIDGGYLYRFDPLKSMVRHVVAGAERLEPRRVTEAPAHFPHQQTVEALACASPDDHVVQISFWRNLQGALDRLPHSDQDGAYCLQRVRVDSPGLRRLRCGDDEYLTSAVLLWNAVPGEDKDLYTLGVSHAMIEIADPHGQWIPLMHAPWYQPPYVRGVPVSYDDPRVHVDAQFLPPDGNHREPWIVVRQVSGRGGALISGAHRHRGLQAILRERLHVRGRAPARWFVTYELTDRIEVIELPRDDTSVIRTLRSILSRRNRSQRQEVRFLPDAEKAQVLSVAGIPVLEQYWRYTADTIQRLISE